MKFDLIENKQTFSYFAKCMEGGQKNLFIPFKAHKDIIISLDDDLLRKQTMQVL